MTELPDWLKGTVLLGKHNGNYVVLAADSDGQLYIIAIGADSTGVARVLRVDDAGQLIMIPRGESGNYLAVDTDGYLTTVIKGAYAGDLRTVSLDDDGRLSAFVIDNIDAWGNMLQCGNAELAARLGSTIRFDQRGRVQVAETFRNGWGHWTSVLSGTGAAAALSPVTFLADGYSIKLTAGSTANHYAIAYSRFGVSTSHKLGLAVSFSINTRISFLRLWGLLYDGSYQYTFGIQYDDVNDDLLLLDADGNPYKFANVIANETTIYDWNHMKIVADMDTAYYVRAQFNDTEYDLSSYQFHRIAAGGSTPGLCIQVHNSGRSGYNDVCYIDNVVFTTAEP